MYKRQSQDSTQDGKQVGVQDSKQDSNTLNKLKETKLDNTKKEIKKKSFDDVFSEKNVTKELQKVLKDFMDMRKTIKKPMTSKALELLIDKVRKMSNDEMIQIAILNQSIERGWQTVYPLNSKKDVNYEQRQYRDFDKFYSNMGE